MHYFNTKLYSLTRRNTDLQPIYPKTYFVKIK